MHDCKCKTVVQRPGGGRPSPIGATPQVEQPECLRETLFSIVHRKHKTNAPLSYRAHIGSQGDICRRGNPTNPAKYTLINDWNTVRKHDDRLRKKMINRSRLSTWSQLVDEHTPVDPSIPPLWSSKCGCTSHQHRPDRRRRRLYKKSYASQKLAPCGRSQLTTTVPLCYHNNSSGFARM